MTREALESEIQDFMRASPWREAPERFERLALALFAFQFEACQPYAQYCRSLGHTPDTVKRSEEIPAIPTGAFKEFELRSFPAERTVLTFRTSGTSVERRGELHLDTLALYETSLLSSLRETFLRELVGRRTTMRFLAPGPAQAPDSSLTHMFETLRREEGGPDSRFDWQEDRLDFASFSSAVERARAIDEPIVVAGTSFAFVHFLDAVTRRGPNTTDARGRSLVRSHAGGGDPGASDWQLPAGSRVIETGGFKGRSREVPREVLRSDLAACFGLPETQIVNQYGMTELGSQFYDSTLVDPTGPRRKLIPPWTRVRFVDPDSGRDVDDGEVGQIVIHDLANTGSLAAIQTADLGRALLGRDGERIGFDVMGREEGAEARGCSIATDAMLEASGGGGRIGDGSGR